MKKETGWLIEDGGEFTKYLFVEKGVISWTHENEKAMRFSRREDAEMLVAMISQNAWVIVEHWWLLSDTSGFCQL